MFVNKSINCLPILNVFVSFGLGDDGVARKRRRRPANIFISERQKKREKSSKKCGAGIIHLQPLSFLLHDTL